MAEENTGENRTGDATVTNVGAMWSRLQQTGEYDKKNIQTETNSQF